MASKDLSDLEQLRRQIAQSTIQLRTQRRWTQAELGERIGLSQGHVSNIERGRASFTAEQLLLLMRIFNVDVGTFQQDAIDPALEIQNALARFGARHLHESERVLPSRLFAELNTLVLEALSTRLPRLMTALAPVVVLHIDSLSLKKLLEDARSLGLARRFGWLVENILEAIRFELAKHLPREWSSRYRRADAVLDDFVRYLILRESPSPLGGDLDILDAEIRSKKTIAEVRADASRTARTWGVVTRLKPTDFASALAAARADV